MNPEPIRRALSKPGRTAFGVSFGWSLGRVIADTIGDALRLVLGLGTIAAIIGAAVYAARHYV